MTADAVPAEDVPVRDAATVVLLRDGDAGLEAWLLTRVVGMAFAAGMTVFPGGRIEDLDAALPLAGSVAAVADGFGCSETLARALVGGALRETFEETGVLLSRPAADLRDARADVEAGRVGFGELLASAGVALDVNAAVPWGRWVTPRGEVRRYDTRFFLAALPPGARAADVTTESSAAEWTAPALALEQAERGERRMLPPTASTMASLLSYRTVAEALAAGPERDLAPVRPTFVTRADGAPAVVLPSGETVPLPGGPR